MAQVGRLDERAASSRHGGPCAARGRRPGSWQRPSGALTRRHGVYLGQAAPYIEVKGGRESRGGLARPCVWGSINQLDHPSIQRPDKRTVHHVAIKVAELSCQWPQHRYNKCASSLAKQTHNATTATHAMQHTSASCFTRERAVFNRSSRSVLCATAGKVVACLFPNTSRINKRRGVHLVNRRHKGERGGLKRFVLHFVHRTWDACTFCRGRACGWSRNKVTSIIKQTRTTPEI